MSMLKDLVSKGVRLIVTEVPEEGAGAPVQIPELPELQTSPRARTVYPRRKSAESPSLPAEDVLPDPPVRRSSDVPASTDDFGAVYAEAGVAVPAHGYGIDKVLDMLESPRLASLGREVKAAAVMAALEAAGAPIKDVIRDAVARDQALDAFEGAKAREAAELRAKNEVRAQAIQEEIAAFLKTKNAELEALKAESAAASEAVAALQARKQREEQRLYDAVAHFIEGGDNPISATLPEAAKEPAPGSGSGQNG